MSPTTTFGRISIVMIVVFMLQFTDGVGEWSAAKAAESAGLGRFRSKFKSPEGHVVIIGNPSKDFLKRFIMELYHEDHGDANLDLEICLLTATPLGDDIKRMVDHAEFTIHHRASVQYTQGSFTSGQDEDTDKRVEVSPRRAFIILSFCSSSSRSHH